MSSLLEPSHPPSDPGYGKVRDYLLYGLSLPERALRSASGIVAGSVRESASLLVPQAFRSSKTYSIMIQQMLDFLAEDVGGVARPATGGPDQIQDFVARKAVGNFVDIASLATLHLSPMLLLAVVGDVAYGSRTYLRELAASLKKQGVIDEHSTIDNVDDFLEAVAGAAQSTAGTLSAPPISVAGLKSSINDTREAIAKIDPVKVLPQAELQRLWDEIHSVASQQGLDPLAVSGAITLYTLGAIGSIGRGALSTVTAAGTLFDRHVLAHYAGAIGKIREQGMYAALRESSQPYLKAVWNNFSATRPTITEDVVSGRLMARWWRALVQRFRRKPPPAE